MSPVPPGNTAPTQRLGAAMMQHAMDQNSGNACFLSNYQFQGAIDTLLHAYVLVLTACLRMMCFTLLLGRRAQVMK